MQNRETRETQNPAMLAVGCRKDVLVWRQQSGVFRSYDDPNRVVRVGQSGMSDAMMVVEVEITPDMVGRKIGVAVAPEFKTKTGKQSEAQRNWAAAFTARSGVYQLVRTPAEMIDLVERVKRGQWL